MTLNIPEQFVVLAIAPSPESRYTSNASQISDTVSSLSVATYQLTLLLIVFHQSKSRWGEKKLRRPSSLLAVQAFVWSKQVPLILCLFWFATAPPVKYSKLLQMYSLGARYKSTSSIKQVYFVLHQVWWFFKVLFCFLRLFLPVKLSGRLNRVTFSFKPANAIIHVLFSIHLKIILCFHNFFQKFITTNVSQVFLVLLHVRTTSTISVICHCS